MGCPQLCLFWAGIWPGVWACLSYDKASLICLLLQRAVDTVHEFSESYHLVCFATGSSDSSLAETGHELVAGAVHQGAATSSQPALSHSHYPAPVTLVIVSRTLTMT